MNRPYNGKHMNMLKLVYKSIWRLIPTGLLIVIVAFYIVNRPGKKPIRVGFAAQLTGVQAELGVQERNGVQLNDILMIGKKPTGITQVLQRLLLLRLFLPLAVLSVIAIGGVGYYGKQTLKTRQLQTVQSMARIVDRYLDQAARTLDSVARVAEISLPKALAVFMQGTWEAYGYFYTLYYLDGRNRITLLVPPDPRYQGLDMSNLSYFQTTGEEDNLIISRPFISLRTCNPNPARRPDLGRGQGRAGCDVLFHLATSEGQSINQ